MPLATPGSVDALMLYLGSARLRKPHPPRSALTRPSTDPDGWWSYCSACSSACPGLPAAVPAHTTGITGWVSRPRRAPILSTQARDGGGARSSADLLSAGSRPPAVANLGGRGPRRRVALKSRCCTAYSDVVLDARRSATAYADGAPANRLRQWAPPLPGIRGNAWLGPAGPALQAPRESRQVVIRCASGRGVRRPARPAHVRPLRTAGGSAGCRAAGDSPQGIRSRSPRFARDPVRAWASPSRNVFGVWPVPRCVAIWRRCETSHRRWWPRCRSRSPSARRPPATASVDYVWLPIRRPGGRATHLAAEATETLRPDQGRRHRDGSSCCRNASSRAGACQRAHQGTSTPLERGRVPRAGAREPRRLGAGASTSEVSTGHEISTAPRSTLTVWSYCTASSPSAWPARFGARVAAYAHEAAAAAITPKEMAR